MGWVCLMYHDVQPTLSVPGGGPERLSVTLDSFEGMLDVIQASGRIGCSLRTALDTPHERPVAITFDDGTAGQFQHAAPALRERGMTATFFVTTDWIEKPGFMTWEQLRQLTSWGMSVQSHTRSHPFLSELQSWQLEDELAASKRTLDEQLQQDTNQLSLPGGNAPRFGSRGAISGSGYAVVAHSRWGTNSAEARTDRDGVRWIHRCTVPPDLTGGLARRIIDGDRRLALKRVPRETALNTLRTLLGPSRYASLRRAVLDGVRR